MMFGFSQQRKQILNAEAERFVREMPQLGAKKIIEFVDNVILHKSYKHRKQNDPKSILAPKINKKDALINWQEDANTIRNLIRGYNPWPIAFTNLGNQTIKIFNVRMLTSDVNPSIILNIEEIHL